MFRFFINWVLSFVYTKEEEPKKTIRTLPKIPTSNNFRKPQGYKNISSTECPF